MKPNPFSVYGRIVLFILMSAGLLAACRPASTTPVVQESGEENQAKEVGYFKVKPLELASMLDNKDFTLINVHTPYAGELLHTDLFIPYDQISQDVDQLPADKNAKIILYCLGGPMSETAAQDLIKLGYTDVGILDGGMQAWLNAGLPIAN